MKLAERFNRDVVEKLSVSETLLYNEITLKLEEMDKRISSLYLDMCAFNSRLLSVEDELRDIDDLRNVDVERIEALEDCVYDKASIDVGSDIEDENHKVNCGETATISNGNGGDDAEWPKDGDKYWSLDGTGAAGFFDCWNDYFDDDRATKSIGNCFRTEEEAKSAVEKLKAWKRMRDAGFKFKGWKDGSGCTEIVCDLGEMGVYVKDLDLLFGEEE